MRTSINTITSVHSESGVKLIIPEDIEVEFVKFFSNPMGKEGDIHPCPNTEVIQEGYFLTREQQMCLIKKITTKEIKDEIIQTPKEKAPGVDSFPIEFFNTYWEDVQNDILNTVFTFSIVVTWIKYSIVLLSILSQIYPPLFM